MHWLASQGALAVRPISAHTFCLQTARYSRNQLAEQNKALAHCQSNCIPSRSKGDLAQRWGRQLIARSVDPLQGGFLHLSQALTSGSPAIRMKLPNKAEPCPAKLGTREVGWQPQQLARRPTHRELPSSVLRCLFDAPTGLIAAANRSP
jgi:hypothetical protein